MSLDHLLLHRTGAVNASASSGRDEGKHPTLVLVGVETLLQLLGVPKNGEIAGGRATWWGKGAEALGLLGKAVAEDVLANLLRGFSPDGSKALVQLQRGHQPGWDLTFSVPKSLSVLWALANEQIRGLIERAVLDAVREALGYVADNVVTRRGKGGRKLEPAGLVVALIPHWDTSRAGDPQLHVHALCLNLCVREDRSFATIRGRDLYVAKMASGQLFRTSLARRLRALGLELTAGKHAFEVKGLPRSLCDAFSTRRKEVEAELARTGTSGARASERAALRTRRPKTHVPMAVRRDEWRETAGAHGFTAERVEELFRAKRPARQVAPRELHSAIKTAATRLANERSSFTRHDLICEAGRGIEHRGPSTPHLRSAVDAFLADRRNALPAPPRQRGEERFAPPWLIEAERDLLSLAERSRRDARHVLPLNTVEAILTRIEGLSSEQEAALRHVTGSPGSIHCIRGLPGTGKTSLLRAVREAYEAKGLRVVGVTLAARAARELEKGAGITSDTAARALRRLAPSARAIIGHHAKQLGRALVGKRTFKLDRLSLNRKTVLVIDEAAMVGTLQLRELLSHTARAGAQTLLVGDDRQLQSIPAGGGFAALCKTLGAAELSTIVRQRHAWMRDAVREVGEGQDVRSALSLYAAAGRVTVDRTRAQATASLISDWGSTRTPEIKDTLILAGTREDALALNLAAQDQRRREGALGAAIRIGDWKLHEGDRVLFTTNHRGLGITNGDLGVLEKVHALIPNRFARVTVKLDREDRRGAPIRVAFTPSTFKAIEAGYALTTHRIQGGTAERTFVLAGGWIQDRELALVQLSRHRDDARLYMSEHDAGPDLSTLAKAMNQTRRKELALAPTLSRPPVEFERGA